MKYTSMPTNDLSFGFYPQRPSTAAPPGWESVLDFVRSRPDRRAGVPKAYLAAFNRDEQRCQSLTNEELTSQIDRIGTRLRVDGLGPERVGRAAAAVAELMFRQIQQRPYRQQVIAAWHLLAGRLVEMQTGEGKSLAAGLAASIAASAGASVYVLTANDYLVARDHALLAPTFTLMGLSSSIVTGESPLPARAQLWRADIVYSTARELGFDYLRDHASTNGRRDPARQRAASITGEPANQAPILPGLCFGIIDEADALLLDEAGVPLILAVPQGNLDVPGFRRAFAVAQSLQEGRHFQVDHQRRRVRLTERGVVCVESGLGQRQGVLMLWQRAIELVETALCASTVYKRDRDYAVYQQQLALIDEFTGRLATGRQWQGALQTMVEIKEGLEPSAPTRVSAQISFQSLFPRFLRLSGMSGTVTDSHRELKMVYGLSAVKVPLRKPSANMDKGRQVVATLEHKLTAVIAAIRAEQAAGRPVLVATGSVAESVLLAARLTRAGVCHQILNALDCADEAAVIQRAGRAGVVTVTTNFAGRGTDIRLSEIARRNGGLSVIATMANRSRRIDRQLFGRAGRQGDPGSFRSIVSLHDRLLLATLGPATVSLLSGLHQTTRGRPALIFSGLVRVCQFLQEWRDQSIRTGLRRTNRERRTQLGFSGLAE